MAAVAAIVCAFGWYRAAARSAATAIPWPLSAVVRPGAETKVVVSDGAQAGEATICSARDLNRRALEQGKFVFVGAPTSNPWVSLFSGKLNFQVVEDGVGGKMYFLNRRPRPGEQPIYQGLKHTGSAGENYATISPLPRDSGQGNVLILQGLRQEGTEALGVLLADAADRTALKHALDAHRGMRDSPYFEALIRAQAVAGAPLSIGIVDTRTIPPAG